MDKNVKNKTSLEYLKVSSISVAVFVVILQCIYEVLGVRSFITNQDVLISIILNILISGALYWIVYTIVKATYCEWWIRSHKEMYLAGRWSHVHVKPSDGNYLRVGDITIWQNFYDIIIEARNYHPKLLSNDIEDSLGDYKISEAGVEITHWWHFVSRVNESGSIQGMYATTKKFSERRTNKGLHQMRVILRDEHYRYPLILEGDFADVCPSNAEGNTKWYRVTLGNRRHRFIKRAPKACEDNYYLRGNGENKQHPVWKSDVIILMEQAAMLRKKSE